MNSRIRYFLVIIVLILSCDSKKEKINFYGKSISVPTYMVLDESKGNLENCRNNIYLKNSDEYTFMNIKLCTYSLTERKNFNHLNLFFEEEYSTLKSNTSDLSWINKNSYDRGKYYEFTYNMLAKNRYYRVVYLAYKKYYISIKISSTNQNKVKTLSESINTLRGENFLDNVLVSESERKNFCLSCEFPYFW
jgi:hypothetical protein